MSLLYLARRFAAFALAALVSSGAAAQQYPQKPVRIVIPFAPGGATDITARLLAERLSQKWGQPVVVENRAGAAGALGAAEVAKAAADGYTLLFPSGSVLTANQHVYRKLPYDPIADFTPVTNVARGPQVLVVPASSPYKTTAELIAAGRAAPGRFNFGSAGIGSQIHLAAEAFVHQAAFEAVHIPYKGEGPALGSLVGGETTFLVANLAAAIGYINTGRLRALAVTGAERAPQLPQVPTVAETLEGFENYGWFGLVAPAGTPRAIVEQLQRDTAVALDATELRARLFTQGLTPVGDSPEAFAKSIRAESAHWAKVVQARRLTAE